MKRMAPPSHITVIKLGSCLTLMLSFYISGCKSASDSSGSGTYGPHNHLPVVTEHKGLSGLGEGSTTKANDGDGSSTNVSGAVPGSTKALDRDEEGRKPEPQ